MTDTAAKKSAMAKTTRIGTTVVFSIALIVFIGGFVPISHPALTRKILEISRQIGTDSCAIGSARVALWKGITLHDLRCSGRDATGHRYTVKAETIVLRGNFIRAALNYKKFKSCTASGKEPAKPWQILCRTAANTIKGVTISAAKITVVGKNGLRVRGEGCSMMCDFAGPGKGDFSGSFSIQTLLSSDVPVLSRLSGGLSCRDGSLGLSRCKGRIFDGKMEGDARIDLVRGTLTACTFAVSGFDIDNWYSCTADTANGRLSGKADCRLVLDSSFLAIDSLRGRGTVAAVHFKVSEFPFQKTLVAMLTYPALARLQFRKLAADFTIKPHGIITTEAAGDGDSLSIRASGWFRIDGQLSEKAECTVSKIAVHTLPKFARETLEATNDGGRVLRLRIFGTIGSPKFEIDSRVILQKAVQNMFDDVRNNIKQWFK